MKAMKVGAVPNHAAFVHASFANGWPGRSLSHSRDLMLFPMALKASMVNSSTGADAA